MRFVQKELHDGPSTSLSVAERTRSRQRSIHLTYNQPKMKRYRTSPSRGELTSIAVAVFLVLGVPGVLVGIEMRLVFWHPVEIIQEKNVGREDVPPSQLNADRRRDRGLVQPTRRGSVAIRVLISEKTLTRLWRDPNFNENFDLRRSMERMTLIQSIGAQFHIVFKPGVSMEDFSAVIVNAVGCWRWRSMFAELIITSTLSTCEAILSNYAASAGCVLA